MSVDSKGWYWDVSDDSEWVMTVIDDTKVLIDGIEW